MYFMQRLQLLQRVVRTEEGEDVQRLSGTSSERDQKISTSLPVRVLLAWRLKWTR